MNGNEQRLKANAPPIQQRPRLNWRPDSKDHGCKFEANGNEIRAELCDFGFVFKHNHFTQRSRTKGGLIVDYYVHLVVATIATGARQVFLEAKVDLYG